MNSIQIGLRRGYLVLFKEIQALYDFAKLKDQCSRPSLDLSPPGYNSPIVVV